MRWPLLLALLCACPESIEVAGKPGPGSGGQSGCTVDVRSRVEVPSPAGEARFFDVRAMGFDGARNLYVLNLEGPPYAAYVTVLSPAPEHAFIRTFGRGELGLARDIAVQGDGTTHIVEYHHLDGSTPVLHRFSPAGVLEVTHEITEPNMQNDQLYSITMDDAETTLFLGGLVMFRYGIDGTYQDSIGQPGGARGEVLLPLGLAWDPRGYLWVADLYRNRIHQYDLLTRAQVVELGGRGTALGTFDGGAEDDVYYGPTRIVIDEDGRLIVNDPWSSRLQMLDSTGTPLGEFSFGGSREIGALAIEPSSGHIYVARTNGIDVVCPF